MGKYTVNGCELGRLHTAIFMPEPNTLLRIKSNSIWHANSSIQTI